MDEDGALYVPGAEKIKPKLEELTNYAFYNEILVCATADCHYGHEDEFKVNGGPFPFHCMMRQPGADKIEETKFPEYLEIPTDCFYDATPKNGQLIFQKQCYDVFAKQGGNDDLEKLLSRYDSITAVVYGVATDYCVKAAVLGLLNLDSVDKVYLVLDAIEGVEAEEGDCEMALGEMIRAGADTCKVFDVVKGDCQEIPVGLPRGKSRKK